MAFRTATDVRSSFALEQALERPGRRVYGAIHTVANRERLLTLLRPMRRFCTLAAADMAGMVPNFPNKNKVVTVFVPPDKGR